MKRIYFITFHEKGVSSYDGFMSKAQITEAYA